MLSVQPVALAARQIFGEQVGKLNTNATMLRRYGADSGIAPLVMPINEAGRAQYVFATGGYTLTTYETSAGYVNGQYSFGLAIAIAITSALGVSDSMSTTLSVPVSILSTLNLSDTLSTVLVIPVSIPETLNLTDSASAQQTLNIHIQSSLTLLDRLVSSALSNIGYVMNVNTGAVSTYEGWDFTSMAKVGNEFYATTPDGLVRIGATDDDGTGIDAVVRTGITDFDSTRMKRLVKAYLGVSSDGQVLLKTITDEGTENIYELQAETSTAVKESPVEIGRGLRARYWQFEVLNEAGSDFTLESVEFYPVVLQRHY